MHAFYCAAEKVGDSKFKNKIVKTLMQIVNYLNLRYFTVLLRRVFYRQKLNTYHTRTTKCCKNTCGRTLRSHPQNGGSGGTHGIYSCHNSILFWFANIRIPRSLWKKRGHTSGDRIWGHNHAHFVNINHGATCHRATRSFSETDDTWHMWHMRRDSALYIGSLYNVATREE